MTAQGGYTEKKEGANKKARRESLAIRAVAAEGAETSNGGVGGRKASPSPVETCGRLGRGHDCDEPGCCSIFGGYPSDLTENDAVFVLHRFSFFSNKNRFFLRPHFFPPSQ